LSRRSTRWSAWPRCCGGSGFYRAAAFGIGAKRATSSPPAASRWGSGVAIGAITFTGSVIAFLKLNGNMSGKPIMLPRAMSSTSAGAGSCGLVAGHAQDQARSSGCSGRSRRCRFLIGVLLLIIPIGGADMPVVVSMLNSYSGWAAAAMGFTLHNTALIITGALVGSSGAILSYIMCKAMNRSFISVIAGGFGGETAARGRRRRAAPGKRGSAEDAAFMMKKPKGHHRARLRHGGGAGAARAARDGDLLKKEGVR
jgi:NAD(P) transhydrogenase subunit beta